jgi:hypothetical protein
VAEIEFFSMLSGHGAPLPVRLWQSMLSFFMALLSYRVIATVLDRAAIGFSPLLCSKKQSSSYLFDRSMVRMPQVDVSMLQAALVGYQHQLSEVNRRISEIQGKLGGRRGTVAAPLATNGAAPKRVLSPAARKRIAAAQKKRWAAFHANRAKPAKNTAKKRTLAPEVKARLAANLAKARAARAAKKAATA